MRRWTELWIAAFIVALDQTTKAIVRATFDLHESVTVVPGFFDLTRVHNTGAAFGLLNAAHFPFKAVVLIVVAMAALAGGPLFAATFPANGWARPAGPWGASSAARGGISRRGS